MVDLWVIYRHGLANELGQVTLTPPLSVLPASAREPMYEINDANKPIKSIKIATTSTATIIVRRNCTLPLI